MVFNIIKNYSKRLNTVRGYMTTPVIRRSTSMNRYELLSKANFLQQYHLPVEKVSHLMKFQPVSRKLSTNATDDIQKQLQCIYKGPLASRMKIVKVFSLTTSLVGLLAQPVLMEAGVKIGGTGMAIVFCSCAGFFTFVTPLLLHFITKKYVTEIHYDTSKDEYIAKTVSLILRKVETKFKTSDVKVPEVPGLFTSFLVDNKPLFVDGSFFIDPEHYARIMGYDKPIDFKLDIKQTDMYKTNHKQPK